VITLADDLGRTIVLPRIPTRIISLVPSITLTLIDLGAGDTIIGRTKFCIHPADKVGKIPMIGGTKKIDVGKVLSLRPDLVIANKEENEKEQIETLSQYVPVFMTDIKNLEDNERLINKLGVITGKTTTAKRMLKEMTTAFKSLEQQIIDQQNWNTLYVIWKDPYLSVGGDTFIHAVMEKAGLINVFRKKKRYPAFTVDELSAVQPDLVLLSSEPFPFTKKHLQHFKDAIPGVKVCLADGEYFSWYGSKMIHAPAYLKKLLAEIGDI